MITRLVAYISHIMGLGTIDNTVKDQDNTWITFSDAPNSRSVADVRTTYKNALVAWRKNPLARRIVEITTVFMAGGGITLTSPNNTIERWITAFINEPQNMLSLHYKSWAEELVRAGNLVIILSRNSVNKMSYARPLPISSVSAIVTQPNDYTRIIEIHEKRNGSTDPIVWLTPNHPKAHEVDHVAILYTINQVVGAIVGEGDLDHLLIWLLKYSRMLEDRIKHHWVSKLFYFIVKARSKSREKLQAQYNNPPPAGSIIVTDTDSNEEWSAVSPQHGAADAQHDLKAVRRMIYAGSHFPPHLLGETDEATLATAAATSQITTKFLQQRQEAFHYIVRDLCFQAAKRAGLSVKWDDIVVSADDVDITDNHALSESAATLALAHKTLVESEAPSPTLLSITVRHMLRFLGSRETDAAVRQIVKEVTES